MEEKQPWESNAGLVDLILQVGKVYLCKDRMDLCEFLSTLGMGLRKLCANQHHSGISTGLRRRHMMLYGDCGSPCFRRQGSF